MTEQEALQIYREAIDAAEAVWRNETDHGSCGMADVTIKSTKHPFARHLKKVGIGLCLSPKVPYHIQNIDVHERAADAMVEVLKRNGVDARTKSWLD